MAVTEVKVPDIGDFKDVDVIEVLVSVGDSVAAEDGLITLETDKASMDVPSPTAGVVKELKVNTGDKVSEGSVVVLLESEGAGGGEAPAASGGSAEPSAPAPAPAPSGGGGGGGGGVSEVTVPDIGDFKDVDVIEVLVAVGDAVKAEDGLITLETDKASMDVPSPAAGVVKELKVKVGDKVSEGSVVLLLEGEGGAASAASAPAPAASTSAAAPAASAPAAAAPAAGGVDHGAFKRVHASPSARRTARELGVDITKVPATGPKSRVTKDDVKRFKEQPAAAAASAPAGAGAPATGMGIPPIPAVDFAQFGEIQVEPLKRIKKLSGAHLHRSWLNVPLVTHHDEADVTELEAFRQSLKAEAEKRGLRVTALAFLMKAVAAALREFPNVNASLSPDGESLILKKYFNVGIAVDTPNGLVVPVFKGVDRKSVYDLSAEMADISKRARDGKLKPQEMQGGCISISSLGGIGGSAFTPLVNAPEVAILGVTRSQMRPVWDGKQFIPRLMMPLDLSYDHRVLDGAESARFMSTLCQSLGDLRRLLL